MSYALLYTKSYVKKAKNFIKQHPDLLKQYQKTLELLTLNPQHPSLRLHKLSGKLAGIYSVSINIAYRITIDFYIEENQIVLLDIGNHDQVYS